MPGRVRPCARRACPLAGGPSPPSHRCCAPQRRAMCRRRCPPSPAAVVVVAAAAAAGANHLRPGPGGLKVWCCRRRKGMSVGWARPRLASSSLHRSVAPRSRRAALWRRRRSETRRRRRHSPRCDGTRRPLPRGADRPRCQQLQVQRRESHRPGEGTAMRSVTRFTPPRHGPQSDHRWGEWAEAAMQAARPPRLCPWTTARNRKHRGTAFQRGQTELATTKKPAPPQRCTLLWPLASGRRRSMCRPRARLRAPPHGCRLRRCPPPLHEALASPRIRRRRGPRRLRRRREVNPAGRKAGARHAGRRAGRRAGRHAGRRAGRRKAGASRRAGRFPPSPTSATPAAGPLPRGLALSAAPRPCPRRRGPDATRPWRPGRAWWTMRAWPAPVGPWAG